MFVCKPQRKVYGHPAAALAVRPSASWKVWVARTEPAFLFNVKAFGLLAGHHVDVTRLPDDFRRLLPARLRTKRSGRIANGEFPPEARAAALRDLKKALTPLRGADKLGYVLFQLAPWIKYSDEAFAGLASLPRALPDTVVAVDFRNRSWFGPRTDETLRFLHDHRLAYVSIDAPRTRLTAPSLPALTASTAVFRLHGRNFAGHLKQVQGKAPTVAEKYDYLYSEAELEEIAGAAGSMQREGHTRACRDE